MLELLKKGFFSRQYIAKENGAFVAEISISWNHKQSIITIQGRSLRVEKQKVDRYAFTLYDGETTLAEVRLNQNHCVGGLCVQYDNQQFVLVNKSWWYPMLLVKSGESLVGDVQMRSIQLKRMFADGICVNLPNDLPLALRVFICWIFLFDGARQTPSGP